MVSSWARTCYHTVEDIVSEVPTEDSKLLNVELSQSLDRCRALVDELRDQLTPDEGNATAQAERTSMPEIEAGPAEEF